MSDFAEEEIYNLDDFLTHASHLLSQKPIKQKHDVFLFSMEIVWNVRR